MIDDDGGGGGEEKSNQRETNVCKQTKSNQDIREKTTTQSYELNMTSLIASL
jgi:hypothetical protein